MLAVYLIVYFVVMLIVAVAICKAGAMADEALENCIISCDHCGWEGKIKDLIIILEYENFFVSEGYSACPNCKTKRSN